MGVVYALLAGLSMGLWSVFTQRASGGLNQILSATLISVAAVLAGLVFMIVQRQSVSFSLDKSAVLWLSATGLMAFLLDYFGLKAYNAGLPLSLGAPVIVATGIAVAALAGIVFLGESLTPVKFLGLALAIAGVVLLSR